MTRAPVLRHGMVTQDLIENVRSIAPILRAEAATIEKQRRLTDKTVAAMKEAGLYRLLVPKCLDGIEANPVVALQVIEEVSYTSGSAGWCLLNAAFQAGLAGAFLGEDAVEEMFSQTPDVIVAGSGAFQRGQAVVAGSKYCISGEYACGSGINHADYVFCGVTVHDGASPKLMPDGSPERRIFYLKRDAAAIGDNWHVLGLQGTGSFDYSITDVFQSEAFSFLKDEPSQKRGGMLYSLGMPSLGSLMHAGFALGIGRRAMDELALLALAKKGSYEDIGNSPSFQEKFALSEAKLRAARSFCFETWNDVFCTLETNQIVNLKQTALIHLSVRHVYEVVLEVCTFAYRAIPEVTLRPSPLQQCYRDISVAIHHKHISDKPLQSCGKTLLNIIPQETK